MTTVNSTSESSTNGAAEVTVFHDIRRCLEDIRDSVCSDISHYPTPIPGCDVDFNRLLEERSAIFAELARLDALRGALSVSALQDFLATSAAIPAEDRYKLSSALSALRSETA